MHYYKRDIGQYYKKAGRLTMLQHGAYTMLMDACYDREIFPTLDQAIDWCWASTNEEIEAVKFVLAKFFIDHDGVYKQRHITEVLEKYHQTASINKAIALEREAKKRAESTKREPIVDDSTTNEHLITNKELLTTNHKLKIKTKGFQPPSPSEVQGYCQEKNYQIDPESFIAFYESNGWKVGKNPMKSWKGALTTWSKRSEVKHGQSQQDNRSRTQRVSDKLRDIAIQDINENGFTDKLD